MRYRERGKACRQPVCGSTLGKDRSKIRLQGCRLSDIERLMVRYNARGAMLGTRLQKLAQAYSRYGNPTLHDMLRDEGLVTNPKRTYAIYTEE